MCVLLTQKGVCLKWMTEKMGGQGETGGQKVAEGGQSEGALSFVGALESVL